MKKVISDYGVWAKQVELKEVPLEEMGEVLWLHGNQEVLEKDDELIILVHEGLFKAGWCEIIKR